MDDPLFDAALALTEAESGPPIGLWIDGLGFDPAVLPYIPKALISRLRAIGTRRAPNIGVILGFTSPSPDGESGIGLNSAETVAEARARRECWLLEEKVRVVPWMLVLANAASVSSLDLSGWASLQHETLMSILAVCGRRLRELILPELEVVTFGPNFKREGEGMIPSLTPTLTPETGAAICEACPALEYLTVHGWREDEAVLSARSFTSGTGPHALPPTLVDLSLHCAVDGSDLCLLLDCCPALQSLILGQHDSVMEAWSAEAEIEILESIRESAKAPDLHTLSLPAHLPIRHTTIPLLLSAFPSLSRLQMTLPLDWYERREAGGELSTALAPEGRPGPGLGAGAGLEPSSSRKAFDFAVRGYEFGLEVEAAGGGGGGEGGIAGADVQSWSGFGGGSEDDADADDDAEPAPSAAARHVLDSLAIACVPNTVGAIEWALKWAAALDPVPACVTLRVPYSCGLGDWKDCFGSGSGNGVEAERGAAADANVRFRTACPTCKSVLLCLCDVPCDNCRLIRNATQSSSEAEARAEAEGWIGSVGGGDYGYSHIVNVIEASYVS